jgi:hypothetical protein
MNILSPLSRRALNILLSLSLILLWIFIIYFMSHSRWEVIMDELAIVFLLYSTLFFGLSTGLIASIVRVIGFIKDTSHFLYSFIGVLNTCLGLFGIYLVMTDQLGEPWVLLFMFSLAQGIVMLIDIFGWTSNVKP